MPFMPFNILGIWFRGLLSVTILGARIYLLPSLKMEESQVVRPVRVGAPAEVSVSDGDVHNRVANDAVQEHRFFRFEPGLNRQTAYLGMGVALLAWTAVGGYVRRLISMMLGGPKPALGPSADEPRDDRTGEVHRITRPDGSELQVECYGPIDAPPVVLTHGWGCNSTEWFYVKKNLADRFRLILWDEPGLGLSKKPDNNDYRLEKLAADLAAVLALAGDRPAVLVGHSIGGMIILTLCKVFPELLERARGGARPRAHELHQPRQNHEDGCLLHSDRDPGHHPALAPDDRALAGRLGDELAELSQRFRPPLGRRTKGRSPEPRPAVNSISVPGSRPTPVPMSWPGACLG